MKVLDLLKEKGISPRKVASTKGGEYVSSCPGCGGTIGNDGLPSNRFHVWPEEREGNGSWWCRQCQKSGDSITFLMEFSGMTYPQACEAVGKELKKPGPYRTPAVPKVKPRPEARKISGRDLPQIPDGVEDIKLWREKAGKLIEKAHQELLKNAPVRAWLRQRGIKKKAIVKFKLGLNIGKDGKDLWRPRESWGLNTELKKNDRKKRLWIPRGLVIPKMAGDKVERVRIRRKRKDEPRYYILPGSSMKMLSILSVQRVVMVVESELDAILLNQEAGDLVSILALGSSLNKPDNNLLSILNEASVILLSLDFDKAGEKACQWWIDHFPQAVRWPVPKGGDPGEAFAAGIDIREWIYSGLPPGWFIGQSFLGKYKKGGAASHKATQGKLDEKEFMVLPSENRDQPIYGLSESRPSEPAVDVPLKVQKLAELIKEVPVAIHVSQERVFLRQSQAWVRKNWDLSKEISNLIFLTPEVFEFICEHPKKVINWKNII